MRRWIQRHNYPRNCVVVTPRIENALVVMEASDHVIVIAMDTTRIRTHERAAIPALRMENAIAIHNPRRPKTENGKEKNSMHKRGRTKLNPGVLSRMTRDVRVREKNEKT